MEKEISRRVEISYQRIDKCNFMVYPRYDVNNYTSFVDVRNLTLADSNFKKRITEDEVKIEELLRKIEEEDFAASKEKGPVLVKK